MCRARRRRLRHDQALDRQQVRVVVRRAPDQDVDRGRPHIHRHPLRNDQDVDRGARGTHRPRPRHDQVLDRRQVRVLAWSAHDQDLDRGGRRMARHRLRHDQELDRRQVGDIARRGHDQEPKYRKSWAGARAGEGRRPWSGTEAGRRGHVLHEGLLGHSAPKLRESAHAPTRPRAHATRGYFDEVIAGFSQPRCFFRSSGNKLSSIDESRAGAFAARGPASSSRSFARSAAVGYR